MLRPAATFSFSLFVTLVAAFAFNSNTVLLIGAISVGVLCVFLIIPAVRKNTKSICIILLAIFLGTGFFGLLNRLYIKPVEEISQSNVTVIARVIDIPESTAGSRLYRLEADVDINGTTKTVRFVSYSDALCECMPFENIECNVDFAPLDEGQKYNSFSERIFVKAMVNEVYNIEENDEFSFSSLLIKLRIHFMNQIESLVNGDAAGIMEAVSIGNKSNISLPTMSNFSRTGISHLVAISGLHISMVGIAIMATLMWFLKRKRLPWIVSTVTVWLFVLTVGAPLSAVRAAMMFTFVSIFEIFMLSSDRLTSLSYAVAAVCIISPFSTADIGFISSVGATFGVLVLAPKIEKSVMNKLPERLGQNKIIGYLIYVLSASVASAVMLMPCSVLAYQRIALVGIIVNIIAIPLMSFSLAFALVGNLLGFAPGLSTPLITVSGAFAKIIATLAKWFSRIPFSSLSVDDDTVMMWMVFTLAMCLAGMLTYILLNDKGRIIKAVAVVCSLSLVATAIYVNVSANKTAKIYVTNGEKVSAIVVESNGEKALFFLSGGYSSGKNVQSTAYNFADAQIDYVVFGNQKDVFFGAVSRVCRNLDVDNVCVLTEDTAKIYSAFLPETKFKVFDNRFGKMNISCEIFESRFIITVNGYKILLRNETFFDETKLPYFDTVICPEEFVNDYKRRGKTIIVPSASGKTGGVYTSAYSQTITVTVDKSGKPTFEKR